MLGAFWQAVQHLAGWRAFSHYVHKYPGMGAIYAAILTGLVAAVVTLVGVPHHTRRTKRIEAALEFSRRYQELLALQHTLNRDYLERRHGKPERPATRFEIADAQNFYLRFFDLMMNELTFFRGGLIEPALFTEWMKWRWYNHNDPDEKWEVCGMPYAEGWRYWKGRKAVAENPLASFLDEVHAAPRAADVDAIVKEYRPAWWHRVLAI